MTPRELVVDPNGQVRQAGAAQADGETVQAVKARAEQSLYFFARAILGYDFLSPSIHKPVADWLQTVPPTRKLLLMPRDHGKTTLSARTLPLHLWIQDAESNPYFPGMDGSHTRILLAGEKEERAQDNLRVIRVHLEQNALLRAFWPHRVWEFPRKQARLWNDTSLILPRDIEYAEPSIRAIGVGGAITGQHPNVQIKDDITTEAAANSATVMQTAIDWHVNTRALFSHPGKDLEFTTATYWAAHDLPHVLENDPSVATNAKYRAITEGGALLWPEKFTPEMVGQLTREFGPRFYLLYMNSVADSALVDFSRADLRFCRLDGDGVVMQEDERDALLEQLTTNPGPRRESDQFRGRRLHDPDVQEELRKRAFRIRTA